jgi:HK97 family phage major capsid protein
VELSDAAVDVDAYRAYRGAFASLLRRTCNADGLKPDVRAALTVGVDRDGGYLVPTEVSQQIEKRLFETSPMREIATTITISSGAWEAPYQAAKGVSGGWVGERQSRPATGNPTVGMQRIEVHEQYAFPQASQSLLDDAAVNVEQWLVGETQDEMARAENEAFVTGDGVMKPKGFASAIYTAAAVTTADATRDWGKLQYVLSGAAAGFPVSSGTPGSSNADALIDIIAEMNPAYLPGSRFVMARRTQAAIRKLKDADGRYLIDGGAGPEGRFQFTIHGFPITNFEDMAALGSDSFSLAFGNFARGYYIVDRIGFRVIRDNLTNKPYVGFYVTKRTGGDVRNFDAIKLMKFAAS